MAQIEFDLKLAVDNFQKSVDKANSSITGFHNDFQKNAKSSSQAFASFTGNLAAKGVELAAKGLLNLASGIGNLGISAIENAGRLESMSVELGVLLGSAAAGEAQLKKLQEFAATSPFQLPGIVEANKLLLAFGTTAGEIPGVLTILGNIAAASGKPLSDLARIFGQVQAETKLSLERLNQLNDAGISLGGTLAKKLGIDIGDVRKAVTAGKVSFDLFKESLTDLQKDGGAYAGGMIKQSQTLEGVISTLKDNFFNLSGEIGKQFLPVIKQGALFLIDFAQAAASSIGSIVGFISEYKASFIAVAAGIGTVAVAWGVYATAQAVATGAAAAFNAVMAINPVYLIALGVAALIAGLVLLYQKWDEVTLFFQKGALIVLEALAPLEGFLSKVFGFDEGLIAGKIDSLKNKIIETQKEIESRKPASIVDSDPGAAARDQKSAEEAASRAKDAADQKLQAQLDAQALLVEAKRLHNENMILAQQEGDQALKDYETSVAEIDLGERLTREQADLESRQVIEQQKLQIIFDAEIQKAKMLKTAEEQKKAITEANQKNELASAQLASKQKLEIRKQEVKKNRSLQDQETADRDSFLNTAATLQNSSNKSLAAIGKAAALTQLAIQTPKAVGSAFAFGTSAGGPVLGAVFAGIAAAAMAAQAAKIAGVGNFATGGFIPGQSFSGDKLQANVNSGEAVLNSSQQREFMKIANGGQGSSPDMLNAIMMLGDRIQNMEIVMRADDNEIARSTSRGIQNGVVLGRAR